MGLRPLVRAAEHVEPVDRIALTAGRLNVGHITGSGASRRDGPFDRFLVDLIGV
jgi:hypothetical protein